MSRTDCENCHATLHAFLCKELRYPCQTCQVEFCSISCSKSHQEKHHVVVVEPPPMSAAKRKAQKLLEENNAYFQSMEKQKEIKLHEIKAEEEMEANKKQQEKLKSQEKRQDEKAKSLHYALLNHDGRMGTAKQRVHKSLCVICKDPAIPFQNCERCDNRCCQECLVPTKGYDHGLCLICVQTLKLFQWCNDCESESFLSSAAKYNNSEGNPVCEYCGTHVKCPVCGHDKWTNKPCETCTK